MPIVSVFVTGNSHNKTKTQRERGDPGDALVKVGQQREGDRHGSRSDGQLKQAGGDEDCTDRGDGQQRRAVVAILAVVSNLDPTLHEVALQWLLRSWPREAHGSSSRPALGPHCNRSSTVVRA